MLITRFVMRSVLSIISAIKSLSKRLANSFRLAGKKSADFSVKRLMTKAVSAGLLMSLLTNPTLALAAPEGMIVSATEFSRDFQHSFRTSSLASYFSTDTVSSLINKFSGKNKQQPIERIIILPTGENNTLTVMQGETINFTAVGLRNEQPVGGILFKWSFADVGRQGSAKPFINGNFLARTSGKFVITAFYQGIQSHITVNVNPNEGYGLQKILQKNESQRTEKEREALAAFAKKATVSTREISSKKVYNLAEEKRLGEIEKQKLEQVRLKQQEILKKRPNPAQNPQPNSDNTRPNGGPNAAGLEGVDRPEAEGAEMEPEKDSATEFRPEPLPRRPFDEDGWDSGNWSVADDPINWVGAPNGSAPDGGASNGNFQFTAPVLSLPGRGIDVNLALNYNSRLWSKAGSQMIYDADKGNPAPGWNIGFGKMVYMGATGGCMLMTPDGTRRSHDGSNSIYSSGSYYSHDYYGYTTDGSFVDYHCGYYSSTYGTSMNGYARLANGTSIVYGSPSSDVDQVYPTQINDAQGNYITITYVNNQGPNIQTITDTLGRTITFNYDSSDRLINITGPGYNNTTRTYVRLHYAQPTLSYAFASGLTTDTATNTPYLLDAIYYPDTNMGYWFGDSSSYSSYGMIAKVISQRGMSWSGLSGTQGTVTQGTTNRTEVYNFDMTANSSLTDAPLYTTYTDTWDRDNGVGTATTTYSVSNTSTTEEILITRPDGVRNKQISINDSSNSADGMFVENQIIQPSSVGSAVLSKTKTYLAAGAYGTSRPTRIEVTDELNQTTSTDFTYGSTYNQVTELKENNYANSLYRKTVNTYESNSAYTTDKHIFSLVKSSEVLDSSGNRLSRVEYEYDNNAVVIGTGSPNLVAAPDVVMHNYLYDPFTSETIPVGCLSSHWNYGDCYYESQIVTINGEDRACEQICDEVEYGSAYQANTIFRGNLTKVTTYANAAPSTPTGAIEHDFTYDVTGNQRTATTDCCQQMTFDYSTATQYSQPDSRKKGNSTVYVTDSATYDFNTGVVKTDTDFNGRTTTVGYDAVARPTVMTMPTGANTTITYGDSTLSKTVATRNYGISTPISQSTTYFNGHGQTVSSAYQAGASNWNETDMQYDVVGRAKKTSMPFDSAGSPASDKWTEYFYDELSRVVEIKTPNTSSTYNSTKSFYNESSRPDSASSTAGNTVRTQDVWGRERWVRTDDFGRLVEVVEPNPSSSTGAVIGTGSSGSLQTTYAYDPLDQLYQINQGSQQRSFAYDSLGRMVLQKLAEQTATINNAGTYVGAGGSGAAWSAAFQYDNRSNLTQKTDARGVKTNFSYLVSGNLDPLNRLQSISYDVSSADTTYGTIDNSAAVTIDYMSANDLTRVWKVTTSGVAVEENLYDATEKGRITDYKLTFAAQTGYTMQSSYDYDSANRLTQVTYPAQFGMSGSPRKYINPLYDEASRLKELGVNGSTQLNDISYNTLSQVTHLKTGNATSNPVVEDYTYDAYTGLLTQQTATRTSTSALLMDLSYDYDRGNSSGSINRRTGNLTHISDNLHHDRDRVYEYDALGRLIKAKGGLAAGASSVTSNWTMDYTYDRYGNKTSVTPTGTVYNGSSSASISTDGLASLSFDAASNRITNSSWVYDLAGNLIKGQNESGVWQQFEYDAAGRLTKVKDNSGTPLETYKYGAGSQRLSKDVPSTQRTYYVWGGSAPLIEYTENLASASTPVYSKSYVYAESRLLSTATNNSGTETIEFHHADRLGTKLVTNPGAGTQFEQATLPFGTALAAETSGTTNQRFTSYDRSGTTGLDYAVNRTYSSGQGRFMQVDPIEMGATSIGNPQSMNLYAYVENNPIDFTDPSGLSGGPMPDFAPDFVDWAGERGIDPLLEYLRGNWKKVYELDREYFQSLLENALHSIGTFTVDATNDEESGVDQDPYLPLPTVTDIIARLVKNSGDCEKYLNAVLKAGNQNTTIRALLSSMLTKEGGFKRVVGLVDEKGNRAEGRYNPGFSNKDKAFIEIRAKEVSADPIINSARYNAYLWVTYHELTHHAFGNREHSLMGKAALKVANLTAIPKLNGKKPTDQDYSDYFNDELRKHCYQ